MRRGGRCPRQAVLGRLHAAPPSTPARCARTGSQPRHPTAELRRAMLLVRHPSPPTPSHPPACLPVCAPAVCNDRTLGECQENLVFGLPPQHWCYVQWVQIG